jgi:hypothetical protein
MKLSFSPAPARIVAARRTWHAAKLAELERELGAASSDDRGAGAGRTLRTGAAYHRKMLELLEELSEELRLEDGSAGSPLTRTD